MEEGTMLSALVVGNPTYSYVTNRTNSMVTHVMVTTKNACQALFTDNN